MMSGVLLTPEIQQFVREQRLGFVATVRRDGTPNVSPKGTTTVWDKSHLMFADIVSPQTTENLYGNPHVEINVVDPIIRKGYRFRGTAVVHRAGADFERGIELLKEGGSTTPRERICSIVVIAVTDINPLVSPAYDLGSSEAEITGQWLAHFLALHGGQRQPAE